MPPNISRTKAHCRLPDRGAGGNDASAFAEALGTVARARGMTEIAKAAGLGRESLYKALRPDAQPRFDTIMKVMQAMGLQISVQPVTHHLTICRSPLRPDNARGVDQGQAARAIQPPPQGNTALGGA